MSFGMQIKKEVLSGSSKPLYRGGCKCGWRDSEAYAQRYLAEIEYKKHRTAAHKNGKETGTVPNHSG